MRTIRFIALGICVLCILLGAAGFYVGLFVRDASFAIASLAAASLAALAAIGIVRQLTPPFGD